MDWTDKLEKFERRLKASDELVVDLETNGLDWKRNKIVSYGFAFGPREEDWFYFPVAHASGNIEQVNRLLLFLQTELKRKPRRIIGHNLIFDLLFLHAAGIEPAGEFVCTMVTQSLINENQKSFNLAECSRIMGGEVKKDEMLYKHLAEKLNIPWEEDENGKVTRSLKGKLMSEFHTLPGDDPVIMEYVIGDVVSTYQLYMAQKVEIEAQDLSRVFGVEVRCTRALWNMQRFGIKVDESKLDQAIESTKLVSQSIQAKMPIKDFNWWSPKQMRDLYKDYDQDLIPKTPKGGLSFNSDFLETHELGRTILEGRQADKTLNTFLEPLKNEHLFNGYVHSRYHQGKADEYGTVSGRLSSSDPNLQQIPKRNEGTTKLIRSMFIPEEGMLWSENDLSQAEYRLFAHYANDPELIAGYNQEVPVDMHTLVSKQLGVSRFVAKTLNFAVLYGSGIDKMRFIINKGLSKDGLPLLERYQVEAIKKAYMDKNPAIKNFMNQTKQVAEQRRYVRTILGRRCRWMGYDDKYYKAANRVIQGSNADYTKLKLAEINEYFESEGLEKARLLVTIHDSVGWQFAEGSTGDKINAEAIRLFQNDGGDVIKMRVPMKVDSHVGLNWSEAA